MISSLEAENNSLKEQLNNKSSQPRSEISKKSDNSGRLALPDESLDQSEEGLTDRELIELEGISQRTLRDWKKAGRSPTKHANNKPRERQHRHQGDRWYRLD